MGINWESPEILAMSGGLVDKTLHVFVGIYIWEWGNTLDFEWEFITRRRRFRWPLIFYFYARYATLVLFIGTIAVINTQHPIDCDAFFTFTTSLGATALGVGSLNLAIRTLAVWGNCRLVAGGLSILLVGQFATIVRSFRSAVESNYVQGTGCLITSTDAGVFTALYIMTMVVDFVILSLTAYKTYVEYRYNHHGGIIKLIFRDGLNYFAVVFLSNLFAVILLLLNLNPILAVAANPPSTVFTTIAACCSVRRLNRYMNDTPQIQTISYLSPINTAYTNLTLSRVNDEVHVEVTTSYHTTPRQGYPSLQDGDLEGGRTSLRESHGDLNINGVPRRL